ncbi:lysophospholipase [Roseibium hamelinense]|uniref:Lysophospholipase n=1 Tax=Roseibium hamelinense TaxID=150831 RepID=A0A562SM07_9HYPH|nr:alpha/beta hydrolase [Roseibium hamelinense]MTI45000.1 alpha/beta hydrolase [Roseibium hamelinense]TWI82262.1 lysophospholipase [Roseibium hamelinense]
MALFDHPDNPIPIGGKTGSVKTADSVRIRYAHWPALGRQRQGTITILQGRAEFIEKYFELISDLRERGFAVIAFDWRGQGGSQRLLKNPLRGHVSDFSRFREDLRTILKKVSLAEYPGPHFAVAHSMGGTVLLSDASRLRTMLDRAVISAPLIGLPESGLVTSTKHRLKTVFRWATLGVLPRKRPPPVLAPKLNVMEKFAFSVARVLTLSGAGRLFVPGGNADVRVAVEHNRQTSDRGRFQRFNALLEVYPELGLGSPTIAWLNAAARTLLTFRKREFGPRMALPCLIVAAGRDRIVSTSAIEEFCSRTKNARYIEIAGAEHELFMERDIFRGQILAALDAFLPGREQEADLERRASIGS